MHFIYINWRIIHFKFLSLSHPTSIIPFILCFTTSNRCCSWPYFWSNCIWICLKHFISSSIFNHILIFNTWFYTFNKNTPYSFFCYLLHFIFIFYCKITKISWNINIYCIWSPCCKSNALFSFLSYLMWTHKCITCIILTFME